MSYSIATITLPLPFGMGSVNCYLLRAGDGHVLVDTGAPNAREILRQELDRLGCRPGALHLIVLTHGDFDHIGNAVHLRAAFGSRIAMHAAEARAAGTGDMFASRVKPNRLVGALLPRLIGFGKAERFRPDVLVEDGSPLSDYGLDATVLCVPGHSKGSIGILTAGGDFFCGDLFDNTKMPALNSLIDDRATAIRSAERLEGLAIATIHPGHGKPFSMAQLTEGRLSAA